MSTDNDVARSLGSWLSEDRHEDADRVLDLVFDQIPATPQRSASWLARRFPPMNNAVKIVIAAAVVVLAAIIGFTYYSRNVGSEQPTPLPSPVALPSPGPLAAGSYVMSDARYTPVAFTFTVPAGWAVDTDGFIGKHQGAPGELAFTAFLVTHVYGNGCHWTGTLVPVAGMTVVDMANALASQQERQISGPVDVTFGGYPAKRVDLSEPAGFDIATCDSQFIRSWPDTGGNESGGWGAHAGQSDTVYLLDVNGHRVVIDRWRFTGTSEADITEMEGIMASIGFAP